MANVYRLKNSKTTHIIGYGEVEGKPASDLLPGDRTLWDFGDVCVVERKIKETNKTVTFNLTLKDGSAWVRTFNKNRIVAIA
jgi:hypothetical protein